MKYFSSEIAGKRISDFQKYDNSINKFEDRLKFVKSILNDDNGEVHDFFNVYFEKYYDASSQSGYLAEQDAVCKTLESLGTYLLSAKDIESNRKIKYRFWKSMKEYEKYKESENVNFSTLEAGMDKDSDVEIVDLFYSKDGKNYKLVNDMRVYVKDVREIEEIKQLQLLIDKAKDKSFIESVKKRIDEIIPLVKDERDLARLKVIRNNVEKFIQSWAKNAKENQIIIKKIIKCPIIFRDVLKDEGVPNKLDVVDFMEEKDVIELLPFLSYEDLMTDLGLIVFDLNRLIDETNLSQKEQEVIQLFREGYTENDIVKELGIKKQNLKTYMLRISKKVVKTYEKRVLKYRDKIRKKK